MPLVIPETWRALELTTATFPKFQQTGLLVVASSSSDFVGSRPSFNREGYTPSMIIQLPGGFFAACLRMNSWAVTMESTTARGPFNSLTAAL